MLFLAPAPLCSARSMSLDGNWRFALDPTDSGERQQWFNQKLLYPIKLPGILQAQLNGFPITTNTPWVLSLYDRFWYLRDEYKDYTQPGKVKVPFLSQPPRHYLGAAWYQRDIEIFQYQAIRRFVLTLERPHWETTVWLDGKKIGSDRSLVAPHNYELGNLTPGRHHGRGGPEDTAPTRAQKYIRGIHCQLPIRHLWSLCRHTSDDCCTDE